MNVTRHSLLKAGLIFCCLLPSLAYADRLDFAKVLVNISNELPDLMNLLRGVARLGGWFLIVRALYRLRRSADYRSLMYSPLDVSGPFSMIFVGVGLLLLPLLMDLTTNTLWGTNTPAVLSFDDEIKNPRAKDAIKAGLKIVRFFGLIAFIRGWFLLAKIGETHQGTPGLFGKGFTHIVGGLLAFHIEATLLLFANSIGYDARSVF